MSLQLNEPPVEYQEFFGRYNEQMPRLIREGRTPMTVGDIMRRRLDVANTPAIRSSWHDSYFDTSDAVLYHPTGTIKIMLDAEPLRAITPVSDVRNGALVIDDETYQRLTGEEFRTNDLTTDKPLTMQQVIGHPIWNTLARNDKPLLRAYANLVFRESKRSLDYDESMGIYLNATLEHPTLQSWYVISVSNRSDLKGYNALDANVGRLVGVAPDAQKNRR